MERLPFPSLGLVLQGMQGAKNSDPLDWFIRWFDDPNYHKLYAHRSAEEAQSLMTALQNLLSWPASRVIDMGCGKGRHAAAIAGIKPIGGGQHQVLGVDLSPASIQAARADFPTEDHPHLDFSTGDMRDFSTAQPFDIALSLFTSFGYFDDPSVNAQVIKNFAQLLRPNGTLVLDFLNVAPTLKGLVSEETVERQGTTYRITRRFSPDPAPGHFFKTIRWDGDQPSECVETERVQALTQTDLEELLHGGGFEIIHTFGDYNLSAFDLGSSPRCLLIARLKP